MIVKIKITLTGKVKLKKKLFNKQNTNLLSILNLNPRVYVQHFEQVLRHYNMATYKIIQ